MDCVVSDLQDVKLITPKVFSDSRGFFFECWSQKQYDALLNDHAPLNFVQDNHSCSEKNVLRGLHFQSKFPQGKLVRVLSGEIYDVVVDLRQSSTTFGQWQGFYLSAENKKILWVPPGFAHGFYTLKDNTQVFYKCTEYYHPEDEHSLIWNDPTLAIDWPLLSDQQPDLSKKDGLGLDFHSCPKFM